MIGHWEIIIILIILVLIFGAKKIPDMARGLGKGLKEFRKALSGKDEDEGPDQKRGDAEEDR
jgi:sec-independent protein translocase protein TatA